MSFDHDTLVWFSKTFGLFYLVALSLAVVAYAYWPSNQQRFKRAATMILDGETTGNGDRPWR
jgi:cytochrome c oxidase cbb3-type subunit 4